MPTQDSINILVADDTLLDELGKLRKDVEADLSEQLKPIASDLGRAQASVQVSVINRVQELKAVLSEKKWDFIALDNHWEPPDGHGELGFEFAETLRAEDGLNRETPLCLFTRHDWLESPENITKMFKLDETVGSVGSFADFFPKPHRFRPTDPGEATPWLRSLARELLVGMKRCFVVRGLATENRQLRRQLRQLGGQVRHVDQIVGNCPRMLELKELMKTVAPSDARVLILGESGAGKELIASALHYMSARRAASYVRINCPGIPETLLESDLFGHEKGAFTGAVARKSGRVEDANGGTVFLDEIGDMSPALQAKLLRFLEDGTFTRVGGNKELVVNVRLIAATNRDIKKEIKESRFREDLYHRLNVIQLQPPRLSERGDDIVLLAEHFLKVFCAEQNKPTKTLSKPAAEKLMAYAWPGNVRELRNVIERAVILAAALEILPGHLPGEISKGVQVASPREAGYLLTAGESFRELLNRFRRDVITTTLRANNGNQAETAKTLQVPRVAAAIVRSGKNVHAAAASLPALDDGTWRGPGSVFSSH